MSAEMAICQTWTLERQSRGRSALTLKHYQGPVKTDYHCYCTNLLKIAHIDTHKKGLFIN